MRVGPDPSLKATNSREYRSPLRSLRTRFQVFFIASVSAASITTANTATADDEGGFAVNGNIWAPQVLGGDGWPEGEISLGWAGYSDRIWDVFLHGKIDSYEMDYQTGRHETEIRSLRLSTNIRIDLFSLSAAASSQTYQTSITQGDEHLRFDRVGFRLGYLWPGEFGKGGLFVLHTRLGAELQHENYHFERVNGARFYSGATSFTYRADLSAYVGFDDASDWKNIGLLFVADYGSFKTTRQERLFSSADVDGTLPTRQDSLDSEAFIGFSLDSEHEYYGGIYGRLDYVRSDSESARFTSWTPSIGIKVANLASYWH